MRIATALAVLGSCVWAQAGCGQTHTDTASATRFPSFRAFAEADSATIASVAPFREMNPAQELDRTILESVAYLDTSTAATEAVQPTRVRWSDGHGSRSHPTLGILMDEVQLRRLNDTIAARWSSLQPAQRERAFREAVRFAALHEYGHIMQFREMDWDLVLRPSLTRVIECQADILGAYAATVYAGNHNARGEVGNEIISFHDVAYLIGSPEWLDATSHPDPAQRQECVGMGIVAAMNMDRLAAMALGRADSQMIALANAFAVQEPDFAARRIGVFMWSLQKALLLTHYDPDRPAPADGANASAASYDLRAATPGDRRAFRARLAEIADSAASGAAALRKLRGALAPGLDSGYVMTRPLPRPWRCILGQIETTEFVTCDVTLYVDSATADRIFEQVTGDLRLALSGDRWTEGARAETPVDSRLTVEFIQKGERLGANVVAYVLHLRQNNIDRVSNLGRMYELAIFMNAPERNRREARPPRRP